jgi:hypothetical protein
MFRTTALAGVVALALGPSPASPAQARRVSLEAADCSQINMMYGDYEVVRAEQHGSVPMSGGTLEVRPESNGGVQIIRGSGSSYGITACIGAGARNRADAQAAADAVRLVIEGNRVRVTGMNTASRGSVQNWNVQLVVTAPAGASIEIGHLDGWGRGLYNGMNIFAPWTRGTVHESYVTLVTEGKGKLKVRVGSIRVGHRTLEIDVG